MRFLAPLLAALIAFSAPPAFAQRALSENEQEVVERFLGPPLDQALNLCITDAAPDIAAIETRWVEAGWPAFATNGEWRVSNIPPGDRVLLSFGVRIDPVSEPPFAGNALMCTLIAPAPMASVVDRHIAAPFGRSEEGIFELEGDALGLMSASRLLAGGVEAVLSQTPPNQRVVTLSRQDRGSMVAITISVFHSTSTSAQ